MEQANPKRKIIKTVETIFDLLYLSTVFIAATLLYMTAEVGSLRWQYALMAFILGIGDASHLFPRIYAMVDKNDHNHTALLGIGKFIAYFLMCSASKSLARRNPTIDMGYYSKCPLFYFRNDRHAILYDSSLQIWRQFISSMACNTD